MASLMGIKTRENAMAPGGHWGIWIDYVRIYEPNIYIYIYIYTYMYTYVYICIHIIDYYR